jgi:predicted RNase H-like HicB family nuclease
MEEAMSGIKEALELCLEEAEENPAYKAQIDFPDQNVSREFKVVEIEVQENA